MQVMFAKWVVPVATACGAAMLVGVPGTTGESRADADCDPGAISAGFGTNVSVLRCYGDWAYASTGASGDSTMLFQRHSYGWRHYTGFPSSVCRDQATADGVPAAELRSFPNCVSAPVIP